MDIIQYILSWILLLFFKFVEATTDEIMMLPKEGQDSIKRKVLQIPREFVSGIRSLADNTHIPLLSMEYQVQIHSSISEVQLIQEFQNQAFGDYIQAEFYYQTRVTQTFVSLEVYSNGQVLKGIVLDKNKQRKKKNNKESEDEKVIPSPYAEIIEEIHDIMRINLGFMYPGQQIKIVIKYVEELEREADNIWKLTLLKSDEHNKYPSIPSFMKNSTIKKDVIQNAPTIIISDMDQNQETQQSQFYTKCGEIDFIPYDLKINGQIISDENVQLTSVSHDKLVITSKNDTLTYFSLDSGNKESEIKDFVLFIKEEKTQDFKSTRSYIGHDPSDILTPYSALIRFSSLVNIDPDETNTSCKDKSKSSYKGQTSFLKTENQNQNEDSDDDDDDEEEEDGEEEEEKEKEENIEQKEKKVEERKENQKKQKKERMLLIVIDDFLQNTSPSDLVSFSHYIKTVVSQFVSKLPQNKKYFVNIYLVFQQKFLFLEYQQIKSLNMEFLKEQLLLQQFESITDEFVTLPIKQLLTSFDHKAKKQYLMLIGMGNYWNINEILFELGNHKKLIVYGIGLGNRISYQLFQRIEQMNCGKSFIPNSADEMSQKIDYIIRDLKAPIFKKFTIIYDQKLVGSISSFFDNITTLSLTKSYSLHVFFNKNFERLIKQPKKNRVNKVSFTLTITDEDNRTYSTKAKIYFNQIIKTNVFHKLAAHQQIQSYLINALYKPSGYSNRSLIREGSSAYERILMYSMKYQILTEVTTMFLLDSVFLICSKNLDQQIKAFQPIVTKLVFEEESDENTQNIIEMIDTLKEKNLHSNDSQQIVLKNEDDSSEKKANKKNQIKQKQRVPEQSCTLNINPLNLNNVLIQRLEQIKVSNNKFEVKASTIYHIKKNTKGQSYNDLVRILKDITDHLFKVDLYSFILTIKSLTLVLFSLMII